MIFLGDAAASGAAARPAVAVFTPARTADPDRVVDAQTLAMRFVVVRLLMEESPSWTVLRLRYGIRTEGTVSTLRGRPHERMMTTMLRNAWTTVRDE